MNKPSKFKQISLVPIYLLLTLVPLISHYHSYKTNLENYDWQSADAVYDVDVFIYPKSVAVCVVAACMLVLFFLMKYYLSDIKTETYPLILYAMFIGFSTLCSQYKYFAIHGSQDQFESVFVLLSYLIISVYCMYVIQNEDALKSVVYALLIGAALIAVIGILQMLKLDPLRTSLGQKLLLLGTGQHQLEFSLPLGRVYATLFNSNYVGAYVSIMFPCVLCAGLAAKKKIIKGLCYLLASVLIIITFGASAKNGLIAISLSVILVIIIYRNEIIRHIKTLIVLCVIFIVGLICVNTITDAAVTSAFHNLYITLTASDPSSNRTLENILTKDDEVELVLKTDSLHIRYEMTDNEMMVFDITDNSGNSIGYQQNGTVIELLDERFSSISIEPCAIGNTYAFTVYVDNMRWDFSNQVNDGTYYFYNYAGKFVKLEQAESAIFTNCPQIFSGRGYIWAKTIPLLKKYFLLGAGPDSFQLVFPQHDYVDLAYEFAPNMLITRAHSMYLQIAVQTGVLSLLCVLCFYTMYFIGSVKIYIKRSSLLEQNPYLFHIGSGLFVGTFGYMLSELVNDSLPVTAPIFWCLIGVGIATNTMINYKYPLNKSSENQIVSQLDNGKDISVKQVPKKKASKKKRKKKK